MAIHPFNQLIHPFNQLIHPFNQLAYPFNQALIHFIYPFRRNIPDTTNHTFLKHCTFDPSTEDGLFCPIFSLQQIVDMMDSSDTYETLATEVRFL